MKTNIIFGLIIIALLAWIGNDHYNKMMDEQVGADLVACPACPTPDRSNCVITAKSVIKNPIDLTTYNTATRFILPDKNLEIKIGKEVFTRTQLDALVPAFVELPIKL